ncbi:hypothetical protein [Haloferula sp.]|uniref:hypothetical protein n=1 Tax=Haloferula sp. TaxID=2497595 RepID=UPI003C764B61
MNRKGYLPHSVVKAVVFWTLTLCVLTATTAGILHSWNLIGDDGAGRWVMTAVILACGSVTFLFINCLFGALGSGLFAQTSPPPPMDPAFGERLRQAKLASKDQKDSIAG